MEGFCPVSLSEDGRQTSTAIPFHSASAYLMEMITGGHFGPKEALTSDLQNYSLSKDGPLIFAQGLCPNSDYRSLGGTRSSIPVVIDEESQGESRSSLHDSGVSWGSSLASSSAPPNGRANAIGVLRPPKGRFGNRRFYLKGHKNHSPPVLPPLALSPQQRLPSFSNLLSSLDALRDVLDPCQPSGVRQKCSSIRNRTGWIASPPDTVLHSLEVSHATGIATCDRPAPSQDIVSSLGHRDTRDATTSSVAEDMSVASVELSGIKPENLMILPRQRSLRGVPSYVVQLAGDEGSTRSIAWDIHVYAAALKDGPRLGISIYYDPRDPYRFPPSSPDRHLWLRLFLHCSDTVGHGVDSQLSRTLQDTSAKYRQEVTKWGLSESEHLVLKLALDTIGDGKPDGSREAQPWQSFLRFCRDWKSSGRFQNFKDLKARKTQAYRLAKRSQPP
jgi:hypothetical protein